MVKAIQLLGALKAQRKKTVAGFLICVCVLCLVWAGYAVYRIERHQMYLRNGRQALERADLRSALSFAQRAVEDRQNDVDASRLMADVLDALSSPTALSWRFRAAQLEPSNVSNYLGWAALGGPGFSVPLGLLIAGVSISAVFSKLLPKWIVVFGLLLSRSILVLWSILLFQGSG